MDVLNMISISHWGQFTTESIEHLLPKGYRFADHEASEWSRPGGLIELERIGTPSIWDNFRALISKIWTGR